MWSLPVFLCPKGIQEGVSGEVSLSLVREEQLKRGVTAQRLWAYHHLHASMVQSTERMCNEVIIIVTHCV